MSQCSPIQTDILMIGFGPVGATMASFLGRYGVQTLVIDRATEILTMPRAIALDNEALRILQNAGLAEDAFAKHTIREVLMKSPLAGTFGRGNTSGSIDGHPKLVTFYQPELEAALRKNVANYDCVTPLLGTSLLSFKDHGDHVVSVIESQNGEQQIVRSRYLIAADGASSSIRESLGLSFKGESYAEDWLIVDAINRDTSHMSHVEFICTPKLPTPHMPAPGGRERWEFMLGKGLSREQALDDGFIRKQLKPWVGDGHIDIERKAVYRFHARCSKTFQKGQVFLIGDAAHITPPFVGQGLVAGLRDAANLSWKLAWVLRGACTGKTLSTYDQERRPHANSMINLARRMGGLIMPQSTLRALVVHNLMKAARLIEPVRNHLEELEIKPKNQYKRGSFTHKFRPDDAGLECGALFPQGLVRNHAGQIAWSDDELGTSFSVVGLGVDLDAVLDEASRSALNALGAKVSAIVPRKGTRQLSAHELEDLENTFLAKTRHKPLVALVRPDRIVMGLCAPAQLGSLLKHVQRIH